MHIFFLVVALLFAKPDKCTTDFTPVSNSQIVITLDKPERLESVSVDYVIPMNNMFRQYFPAGFQLWAGLYDKHGELVQGQMLAQGSPVYIYMYTDKKIETIEIHSSYGPVDFHNVTVVCGK